MQVRQHKQVIDGPTKWQVSVGGILGRTNNTAILSYPVYPDYLAPAFEPNLTLTIRNLGPIDLVNPRVTINGQGMPRELATLVDEAITE